MKKKLVWSIPAAALIVALAIWLRPGRQAATGPPGPPAPPQAPPAPQVVVLAPKPPATAPAAAFELPATESSFLLPVELRLDDVKPLVEAAVPRKFEQTVQLGDHGVAKDVRAVLRLTRGEVTLTPQGERLAFSFPLTGSIPVKARIDAGPGDGFAAQETIENVRAVVSGWVKVGVDGRWNFVHESDAALKVDKADVKFPLGISFSVRERLEEQTKGALAKLLNDSLDAAGAKLNVRDRADAAWTKLHATRLLRDDPKVGVSLRPTAVHLRPLRFEDDGFARAAMEISASTVTSVGAAATHPERRALPELLTSRELGDRFHLVLAEEVPVAGLHSQTHVPATKATEMSGGVDFKVTRTQLWWVDQNAHLKIEFEAAQGVPARVARGTLYACGTMAYDPREQVLRVNDLAFDAETASAIYRDAGWLPEKEVLQAIKKSAVFPLDNALANATGTLAAQVAKAAPHTPQVAFDFQVGETRLRDVRPRGDALGLLFDVTGTARGRLTLEVPKPKTPPG